jgi:hypothetical protein
LYTLLAKYFWDVFRNFGYIPRLTYGLYLYRKGCAFADGILYRAML